MTMFWCDRHSRMEDDEAVGRNLKADNSEVCDESFTDDDRWDRQALDEVLKRRQFHGRKNRYHEDEP